MLSVFLQSTDPDAGLYNFSAGGAMLFAWIGGFLALFTAAFFAWQTVAIPLNSAKKQTIAISVAIQEGAQAFLMAEYKVLVPVMFALFIALIIAINWQTAICFIIGGALSASAGYVGMTIATRANIRTTFACEGNDGMNAGLRVAFKSGAVMALTVTGFGLVGIAIMYSIFDGENKVEVWSHLSGFAFGASTIALFARVGGGIYTKAADVGADLVGKVEEDLDEDSADNPATIADNVGDNVGDVAGMGADLFESYCGSLIAAATLGNDEFPGGKRGIALPFYVAGFGAIASILGTFAVRTSASPSDVQVEAEAHAHLDNRQREAKRSEMILESLLWSIRRAIGFSSVLVVGFTALSVALTFGNDRVGWQMMVCVIIGLFCGNFIGYFTEYATSYTYYPTQSIAIKSNTGPATVLIQGLGVGMLSTVPPVFFVVVTILAAYYIGEPHGFYGISITAVGMLSTLGMTLATDAFGPVADNAGGIAEMAPPSEISRDVRDRTDALDALGNTTAATGKGFAIGSAVLTSLALMRAFAEQAGVASRALSAPNQKTVDILNPVVLPGILLGAMLPFVFAALTMLSVGKAAESVMWECRDQLNKKYFDKTPLAPAYCVRIVTLASLREMVLPGAIAVFSPIMVGVLLGAGGLLGLLSGSTSSGFLLGLMMSNAGGAWDNAKKYVEKGNLGEGKGKKSPQHKACVVGDTVGDPFKDTSGPALNILIKLMSIVCLVLVQRIGKNEWASDQWWWSLILTAILVVLSYIFKSRYMEEKFGSLHNYDEIEKRSRQRKEQTERARGDHDGHDSHPHPAGEVLHDADPFAADSTRQ